MIKARVLLAVGLGLSVMGAWTVWRLDDTGPDPAAATSPTAHSRDPITLIAPEQRGQTPDLTVIDAQGKSVRLSTLWAAKPVLVHFWATWCAPCIAELPGLDALARTSGGDLTILPISLDRDGIEDSRKYFASHHMEALQPLASAPDSPTPDILPTSILIDRMGREAWKAVGAHPWTGGDVQKAIAALR